MAKKMSWLNGAALATTVALALVQVPALAQNTTKAAPPATAPAAAAPAPADAPAAPVAAAGTTDPSVMGAIDPFAHGTAANGATKSAVCSSCHGPNGNSANPDWPRLAGQSAVYIAEQLRMFRSGARNNPIMKPLAGTLSDQDINDLAVYYQAQTPAGLEADPSFWKAGSDLYRRGDKARGIPACIACHGPVGRGNIVGGYPALRAQQSVYVVKQLNDYASGARYTPDGMKADPNSAMMFTIAKRLTPEDIRNLASYVQGIR